MDLTLGQLLRNSRQTSQLTREQAAERVGKSNAWIGEIEKDRRVPALDLLLRLHEKLAIPGRANSDLGLWLLKWLEATAQHDLNSKEEPPDSTYTPDRDNRAAALAAVRRMFALSGRANIGPSFGSRPPTLQDFPHGFSDLLIVCGDRREWPPKNRGDLFVDSFSSADLASLKILFDKTGPLEIRSDKYFALDNPANDNFLKHEYGRKNIIVIGSPAVNLLARIINKYCVFRFQHSKTVREFLEYWDKGIPEINDRRLRTIFWDMASKWKGGYQPAEIDTHRYYEEYKNAGLHVPEEQIAELARKVKELLKDLTVKDIKNLFHKAGFLDPVDVKVQGFFLRDDNDFGVISLCPNPYADEGNYFCILAAGIHAPGTYTALKTLATNDFETHPLGGVIEAKLDLDARWIERFPSASVSWQTSDYKVDHLIPILTNPEKYSLFEKCDLADLKILLEFVKRFITKEAAAARA